MKISLSKRILSQAAAAALAVLFVFPIYWMIVTSLKPNASILRLPLEFWPGEFTGANYRAILSDGLFPIYYKNNLIVSLATTVLTLLIAIMAAYAFSRFPFRGSRALQMLFLSTQMFPAVVLLIALYSLYAKLGLINTYTALILACAVCFTIHILVIDHFTATVDGVKLSCLQFLFAAIISAVCMFIFEDVDMAAILSCVMPLLYVGIFSCGVGYTLQILAQKDSNPTVVTILLSLESVFAVIAGAIILKQQMSVREYIGCGVMFAAVILAQIQFPTKQKAE